MPQPSTTTNNRYLLLVEAAEVARTSVQTVRYWIQTGRLRSTRPGRCRLIKESDLHDFITRSATGGPRGGR